MIERINLIPEEIRRQKRALQTRPLIIAILVIYAIGLGAVHLYQTNGVKKRLAKVERLRIERDNIIIQNMRYKDAIEKITQAQKREEDIKKRLDIISSLLEGRVYWSELLKNITHLVPDEVWLTSLSTYDAPRGTGKGVKFNGTAAWNSGIAEFVFAVENSRFFGNVQLGYSQKRELKERDIYDFEITADLKEINHLAKSEAVR